MVNWIRAKFTGDIPVQYRSNFFHLVADIFWFGILNGTSLSFTTVYLTRIGGNAHHLGWLAAAPAIINMIFAIPFGSWLTRRNTAREVVISSIIHRAFYLLWVPVPILFAEHIQIWVLIGLTFVMFIPGTILQVGFNDMFAESVPMEWRALVAGMRNAALAFTTVVISLIGGQLLVRVAFPLNYQILFMLGFLGSAVSSYHLWRIWKNLDANPVIVKPVLKAPRMTLGQILHSLIPDFKLIYETGGKHFFVVILCLFGFHFTQYLVIPLLPVYMVNNLKLDDNWISIGNGIFYVLVFIVSTQLGSLARRVSNKKVVGIGLILMGLYPGIMALAESLVLYIIASIIGGIAWGLAGGVIYNYLLENMPESNRPPFLALYNFVLYAAILIGSLSGPVISGWIGVATAMLVFGVGRILAGMAILRWG
jgi:MFS family permease